MSQMVVTKGIDVLHIFYIKYILYKSVHSFHFLFAINTYHIFFLHHFIRLHLLLHLHIFAGAVRKT